MRRRLVVVGLILRGVRRATTSRWWGIGSSAARGVNCSNFTEIAPVGAVLTYSDTTVAASTSYSYRVRAVDAAANLGPYSNPAPITVGDGPAITTQPAPSQTIASGTTATLSVVASGTAPLTYQWYQGASGVTTAPVGTNSASFTTAALTVATSYWVRVSNLYGQADSATAAITIGIDPGDHDAACSEPDDCLGRDGHAECGGEWHGAADLSVVPGHERRHHDARRDQQRAASRRRR